MSTRLRQLRVERGWTQAQLADRASVAQSTLSQYESGTVNPTLKVAQRIASALGVSLEAIIDAEEQPMGETA